MHYPPLSDGTFRYGDPPRPLPSPVPGPDPGAPAGPPPPGWAPGAVPHGHPQHGPGAHHPPQYGPPRDGPPQYDPTQQFEQPPGRSNGAKGAIAIGGILGGVAVVALALAVFGPSADRGSGPAGESMFPSAAPAPERLPGSADFAVDGTLLVSASPGEPVSGDAGRCELPPTLSDIGTGTRIGLLGPTGAPIATAMLSYGGGDQASCTFAFDFEAVPAGEPFYLVEIPGRGQLQYTERELREGVDVTLGR